MENLLTSADVNECLFQDACDASCVCNNTVGSYRCENCQNVNGIPAGPSLLASLSGFCILLRLRCAPERTARSYNEFIPIHSSKLDGR